MSEENLKESLKKKPITDISRFLVADSNGSAIDPTCTNDSNMTELTFVSEPQRSSILNSPMVSVTQPPNQSDPLMVSISYKKLVGMKRQLRCMRAQISKKNKTIYLLRQVNIKNLSYKINEFCDTKNNFKLFFKTFSLLSRLS